MDPQMIFALRGVLPTVLVSLLALAPLLLLRRLPRAVRAAVVALFVAGAYGVGYVTFNGVPAPPLGQFWQVMLSTACLAGVLGVVVELMPTRYFIRDLAFPVVATVVAVWAAPPANKIEAGQVGAGWYVATMLGASVALYGALRVPAKAYPAPLPPAALCVAVLVGGFLFAAYGDSTRPGFALMLTSVPLGAFAVATLFRSIRDVAAAAVTPAALTAPGVLAVGYYYNDPGDGTPRLPYVVIPLLAAPPLLALVALVPPLRRRPWVAFAVALGAVAGATAAVAAYAAGHAQSPPPPPEM